MKRSGDLPADLWITSSDDFSSWGGGDPGYRTQDLENLIKAVDYVSMHTYPMHNSHYNPQFWKVPPEEEALSDQEKIHAAMLRAKQFVIEQYQGVLDYMRSLGVDKCSGQVIPDTLLRYFSKSIGVFSIPLSEVTLFW